MQAVRFHEYGDAAVLRLEEAERPEPGAGEVRVRVAATTFNPVDGGIRGGWLQGPFPVALPHVPGIEVAGTVDALGAGVDALAVGDRVFGFLSMTADGASAEHVVTSADLLAPAPARIPLEDAAALPMVGLTAYQALFQDADLRPGQRVLVNGAGGAVGALAVQLATNAGAHVIATASPRSAERVRAAGAHELIDHAAVALADAVRAPVDVLLNLARVEGDELAALVPLVRTGGVVVNSVPTIPTPTDEHRDVRGVGVFVRSDREQLALLAAMVDRGELHVDIARRVPLAALPAVHAEDDAGTLSGKVLVVVGA